jgi:hypothetical protein
MAEATHNSSFPEMNAAAQAAIDRNAAERAAAQTAMLEDAYAMNGEFDAARAAEQAAMLQEAHGMNDERDAARAQAELLASPRLADLNAAAERGIYGHYDNYLPAADLATIADIAENRDTPRIQDWNERVHAHLYGSRGRDRDPATGAIADEDTVRPGLLETMRSDPRAGKTPAERAAFADAYQAKIQEGLDAGMELVQAKLIADRRYDTIPGVLDGIRGDRTNRTYGKGAAEREETVATYEDELRRDMDSGLQLCQAKILTDAKLADLDRFREITIRLMRQGQPAAEAEKSAHEQLDRFAARREQLVRDNQIFTAEELQDAMQPKPSKEAKEKAAMLEEAYAMNEQFDAARAQAEAAAETAMLEEAYAMNDEFDAAARAAMLEEAYAMNDEFDANQPRGRRSGRRRRAGRRLGQLGAGPTNRLLNRISTRPDGERRRGGRAAVAAGALGLAALGAFLVLDHKSGGGNGHHVAAAVGGAGRRGDVVPGHNGGVTPPPASGGTGHEGGSIPGVEPGQNVDLNGATDPWTWAANVFGPNNATAELHKLVAEAQQAGIPVGTRELPGFDPSGHHLFAITYKGQEASVQQIVNMLNQR